MCQTYKILASKMFMKDIMSVIFLITRNFWTKLHALLTLLLLFIYPLQLLYKLALLIQYFIFRSRSVF